MAKWTSNLVLDGMLDKIATATTMLVCTAQPTDRAAALSLALADVTMAPADTLILEQYNILNIFDATHPQTADDMQIFRHIKPKATGRVLDNVLSAGRTRQTVVVARVEQSPASGKITAAPRPVASLRRPMASITKIIP